MKFLQQKKQIKNRWTQEGSPKFFSHTTYPAPIAQVCLPLPRPNITYTFYYLQKKHAIPTFTVYLFHTDYKQFQAQIGN